MTRYILLILLSIWSYVVPLTLQCDTGVAVPNHELSVAFSLMSNADVSLLKIFKADNEQACLKDCCLEKYGSCSVASFKKNASKENCLHFNCRPVLKCKFVSSNSTDSFSLTSSTLPLSTVPSTAHSSSHDPVTLTTAKPKVLNSSPKDNERTVTKEVIATFSEEHTNLKNDNTTIKPRKGVDDENLSSENDTKSGIKPRKGVIFDDNKSKSKPRKGVGPYELNTASSSVITAAISSLLPNASSSSDFHKYNADDVVSALEKVFEDDTRDTAVKPASTSVSSADVTSTSSELVPSVAQSSSTTLISSYQPTFSLHSSFSTSYASSSSAITPTLQTTAFVQSTETVTTSEPTTSTSSSNILEHSKLLFLDVSDEHDETTDVELEGEVYKESESERKYKSSMRLVLSLVFGLLVLFFVMGVIAKRVYDSWMRRHYRRMDFLIDGMYNGYG